VIDHPMRGVFVDGDAELDGDVAELGVVVAALPARVLHTPDGGDAVGGFVQQRAEQGPGLHVAGTAVVPERKVAALE